MDLESRLELIRRVGEEIITEPELRGLLETNDHPVAYDGFEPSGLAHVPFGVLRAINLEDLLKAGVKVRLWVADWFAWVNNKMGGDLEKIQRVGKYFVEVWKAAGVDLSRVEILWTSDAARTDEYWKKVITVAQNVTLARARRALTIMGRTSKDLVETVQLFYPMMQVADIFWLDVDICQLGLDQRRANILAREIAGKLKWKKPVAVHHHLLMSLQGVKELEGYDENTSINREISSKMSKSRPESSIFVHDGPEEITKKISNAFCPPKVVVNNPILEYCKFIIFRRMPSLKVRRPEKYGGDISLNSYSELETQYREGKLHPKDLKGAVSEAMDEIIRPIRRHFETDPQARRLYQYVKSAEITR